MTHLTATAPVRRESPFPPGLKHKKSQEVHAGANAGGNPPVRGRGRARSARAAVRGRRHVGRGPR
ncbi:hypothetical protein STXM2123_5374 [Streptomyces sp. F-3]|nr:hypothetical protein STXM2123_5374 [Streptomyces sp. F-3]